MLNDINLKVIPHSEQRYNTVGDYWVSDDGTIQVRISELGDYRYEFLVALHELVELLLCKRAKIDFAKIDEFDIAFEANRVPGDESEPGADPSAPYHREHMLATAIERSAAVMFGVDWDEYDAAVRSRG